MALLRESGRSWPSVAEIEAAGGPHAALERRLGLLATHAEEQAERAIDRWRQNGITPLACTDPGYPAALRDADRPPPLLFLRGQLEDADCRGVAVIGTRAPSPFGSETATALAEVLLRMGRTVVSGLAAGIDTAAHLGALRRRGRTIAVLGTGLNHVYPPSNVALQERIPLLISQFWPEQPPGRNTFPRRNAVMSALTVATVIVEAGDRSGARIQARHALAQGRRLVLMAPLLSQLWAQALARQSGVSVIEHPEQLVGELEDV